MKKLLLTLMTMLPATLAADTFSDLVAEVAVNNPALRAERAAALSETMARVADNRLEPTEVSFSHVWPSTRSAGTKMSVEVSQSFDWPGAYGARRRASRAATEASRLALAASERDLGARVAATLLTVVDANLRCDLLERIVANLDSMHNAAHTMLDAGQITELDHRKVALEEISMKQQLADAHSARSTALAELAALNGGTVPTAALDLRDYPSARLAALADYLAAPAPEVESAAANVKALLLDARASRMDLYPGFSLAYVHENEDGVKFNGFSLGLRLPSYSATPRAKAAELAATAAGQLAADADNARRAQIVADHATAQQLIELLKQYDYAFGEGDYESLLLRSLRAGQISYADYFTELNFFLAAKLEALTQTLRLQTLLATLNSRLS